MLEGPRAVREGHLNEPAFGGKVHGAVAPLEVKDEERCTPLTPEVFCSVQSIAARGQFPGHVVQCLLRRRSRVPYKAVPRRLPSAGGAVADSLVDEQTHREEGGLPDISDVAILYS